MPADDSGIRVGGESADQNTSAAELSDVDMTAAEDRPLVLREGENQFTFKLSRAVYCFEDGSGLELDEDGSGHRNPKADWGKLLNGLRICAVYTYRTASGDEKIAEGTGAVVETE